MPKTTLEKADNQIGKFKNPTTMLSISPVVPSFSLTSAKYLRSPSSYSSFFPKLSRLFVTASSAAPNNSTETIPRVNNAGLKLNETVDVVSKGKIRLDSWISSRVHGVSRARVQSSIRQGLVSVNGQVIDKVLIPIQIQFLQIRSKSKFSFAGFAQCETWRRG